ncbi:methyltransferase [Kibdelosporangium aridum]|uniref:Methyltransferase n=1 Tax=Kibdelosporangium aridum TaxID=2030 RepID=A0A428Z0J3_KIBAR|nr:O-methyltransferase [Kibdelosporangium aridum]RSM77793.1 methyltransferase [Kibdelosporangium aridum]
MPAPIPLTLPGVEEYADACTTPDSEDLLDLARLTTAEVDRPHMMVGPVEARFLQFLLTALRPARILEIGTYTGYSALSMAQVLPADAHITTCELNEDFAAIAAKHFAASPHADKITLEVGPALDTIARLSGKFDFILLDADQPHFDHYLEPLTALLSDNGILAADNTLWSGSVLDESDHRPGADGIRRFNRAVAAHPGLVSVLLTVRDGLMLIRRK